MHSYSYRPLSLLPYRMYRSTTMHRVTDGRTDRQTDDIIMPIAHHTIGAVRWAKTRNQQSNLLLGRWRQPSLCLVNSLRVWTLLCISEIYPFSRKQFILVDLCTQYWLHGSTVCSAARPSPSGSSTCRNTFRAPSRGVLSRRLGTIVPRLGRYWLDGFVKQLATSHHRGLTDSCGVWTFRAMNYSYRHRTNSYHAYGNLRRHSRKTWRNTWLCFNAKYRLLHKVKQAIQHAHPEKLSVQSVS